MTKHVIIEKRVITYKQYKTKTPRNAMACLIKLGVDSSGNDRRIWFINTHLGCHSGDEQFSQSKELYEFIENLIIEFNDTIPIIVVGDTNSPPWFKALRALKGLDVNRGSIFKRVFG